MIKSLDDFYYLMDELGAMFDQGTHKDFLLTSYYPDAWVILRDIVQWFGFEKGNFIKSRAKNVVLRATLKRTTWDVFDERSGGRIGRIEWYNKGQCYVFQPKQYVILSRDSLEVISHYLGALKAPH